nr:MAG TPA: hypothetical protein [Caudoviricetes sp.]
MYFLCYVHLYNTLTDYIFFLVCYSKILLHFFLRLLYINKKANLNLLVLHRFLFFYLFI